MKNQDNFSESDKNFNQSQPENNSQTHLNPEEAQTKALYDRAKQEWLDSGIAEDVIALNLKVDDGYSGFSRFITECNLKPEDRINSGCINRKIQRTYAHLYDGYWYIYSYNPITGEKEIVQVKPFNPRSYADKLNGTKIIKYETPKGKGTPFILPNIPDRIIKRVAQQYNIEELPKNDVAAKWGWIREHTIIPVAITEGLKKAASLISHGIIAIACLSITTHSEKKKEFEDSWFTQLKPELRWLLEFGNRDVYIIFDQADKKLSSRIAVSKQTKMLGYKLKKLGCSVKVITWTDRSCKGIDDYIVKYGEKGIEHLYKFALPFQKFLTKLRGFIHRKLTSDIQVNVESCTELIPLIKKYIGTHPDKIGKKIKAVFVRSQQRTEKTEMGKQLIDYYYEEHQMKTLDLNYRRTLARNSSKRLGLKCYLDGYKKEQIKDAKGLSICADSHHKLDPSINFLIGYVDECEQFLWHILDADTDIKERRADKISALFRELIAINLNGGFNLFFDADLSDKTIRIATEKLGLSKDEFLVIDNIYKPFTNRTLYIASNPEEIRAEIEKHIKAKKRICIHTSGQQFISKHGTINLESWIKKAFPEAKIIRIDQESISEEAEIDKFGNMIKPAHPAYKIMDYPQKLRGSDIILYSGVMNTGVSLDDKLIGKIDAVFGIYSGNYPLDHFEQGLERYRGDCPRFVFCAKQSNNKISYGETRQKNLMEHFHSQIKLANMYCELEPDELRFSHDLIRYYADFATRINSDYKYLRDSFIVHEENKGYKIESLAALKKDDKRKINEIATKVKEKNTKEYCQKASKKKVLGKYEYSELKKKKDKTAEERLVEKRSDLHYKYGELGLSDEKLADFLECDLKHNLYPKIMLNYYLRFGTQFTKERDKKKAREYVEKTKDIPNDSGGVIEGETPYFKEFIRIPYSTKTWLLEQIGLADLVNNLKVHNRSEINNASLLRLTPEGKKIVKEEFLPYCFTNDKVAEITNDWDRATDAFKLAFDIDLNNSKDKSDKGMVRFKMVLNRLGLDIGFVGKFGSGNSEKRYYAIVSLCDKDVMDKIMANFFTRDNEGSLPLEEKAA